MDAIEIRFIVIISSFMDWCFGRLLEIAAWWRWLSKQRKEWIIYFWFMCLSAELSTGSRIHSFFHSFIRVFIDSLVHSAVDWSVWSCRPQDIQRFFVGYLKLMDIFSGPEDGWVDLGQMRAPVQQLQPGDLDLAFENILRPQTSTS